MAAKIMCVLFIALVFSGIAMPIANAQLGLNLGGLLNSLLSVSGIVPCSVGGSLNVGTTNGFPNAGVQLRCAGNVVGSATTSSTGAFSIIGGLPTSLLSSLLGTCNIVVTTPLASCNISLPSTGFLTAGLSPVSNLLGVTNLVPGVFQLVDGIV